MKHLIAIVLLIGLIWGAMPSAAQDWQELDDTDPRLAFGPGWETVSIARAYGGTLTYAQEPGAFMGLRFEGTAIELLHSVGPDGGTLSAQLSSDGEVITVADKSLLAEEYDYQQTMSFEGLMPGTYTLSVTVTEGAVWIEGVRVLGEALGEDTVRRPDVEVISDEDGLTMVGHTDGDLRVAFSLDGTRLASVSRGEDDQVVRVWSVNNGGLIYELAGHTDRVYDLAWAPDGSRLATASHDQTVRLWDMSTGEELGVQYSAEFVAATSVSWSPDGTQLAIAAQRLIVVDVEQSQIVADPPGIFAEEVRWAPNSSYMAILSGGDLQTWEPFTGLRGPGFTEREETEGFLKGLDWSSDGTLIATYHEDAVQIWNNADGALLQEVTVAEGETIVGASWSPDGALLLIAVAQPETGSQLRFYEPTTATEIDALQVAAQITSVEWSPDGLYVAWTDAENMVHLWPVQ